MEYRIGIVEVVGVGVGSSRTLMAHDGGQATQAVKSWGRVWKINNTGAKTDGRSRKTSTSPWDCSLDYLYFEFWDGKGLCIGWKSFVEYQCVPQEQWLIGSWMMMTKDAFLHNIG